ncbi:pyridoxal-phosphate dependent enzyme [Ruegeria arenilitoris]|uniref:pyridoxal-phosphate dependent enzyme n=1 Tax=Ruegeria arenilitoris TaxID=1173585 RepID=UPI0020C225AF|nr:pyridoxal-phosphate dependent enzyme [Ruegeria arenilitoris]
MLVHREAPVFGELSRKILAKYVNGDQLVSELFDTVVFMEQRITLDPEKPRALWRKNSVYGPTPLDSIDYDGRTLLVKDETARMGLGAFKALGGIYAVAQMIADKAGISVAPEGYSSDDFLRTAEAMTFVCASAGNHGMAVAAGAAMFGAKARIHLAETVPEAFATRLREKGAEVVRSGEDYEASIAAAIADAESSGAVHLADGSWTGYTEPPRLVMEGYTVMAEEMRETFEATGSWPSHVYLQAGVGGLAAAVAYMIRSSWAVQPRILVVEPDAAPCLRESARAGQLVTVSGPTSNMGRLDCKTPSMLAYEILRDAADEWLIVTDAEAEEAVGKAREMGYSTTPSGAAGLTACLAGDAPHPLVILSERGLGDD